jgi:hypothetical protein
LDCNQPPSKLMISTKLRQREDYLYGTFDKYIAIPKITEMARELGKEFSIGEPLYRALPASSGILGVEQRLIQSKVLLTARSAEIEVEKTTKNSIVLLGQATRAQVSQLSRVNRKERAKRVDNALRANTAFSNLLKRRADGSEIDELLKMGFDISSLGKRRFTLRQAIQVLNGFKGDTYTAQDIYIPEDMYLRKDVSTEESLKVGGIELRIPHYQSGRVKVQDTVAEVGLYKITGSRKEWSDKLENSLSGMAEYKPIPQYDIRDMFMNNREWVNDDNANIEQAIVITDKENPGPKDYLIYISTDVACCRRMADTVNIAIVLVSPAELMRVAPQLHPESYEKIHISAMIGYLSWNGRVANLTRAIGIIVDTGSARSHGSHRELYHGRSRLRQSVAYKYDGPRQHRMERVWLKRDGSAAYCNFRIIKPEAALRTGKIYISSKGSAYSSLGSKSKASVRTWEYGDSDKLYHEDFHL